MADIRGDASIRGAIILAQYTESDRNTYITTPVVGQIIEVSDGDMPGLQRYDGALWRRIDSEVVTLQDQATVTWDAAHGSAAYLQTSNSRNLAAISNPVAGEVYSLVVNNSSGLDVTLTLASGAYVDSQFNDVGATTVPANQSIVLPFQYDGTQFVRQAGDDSELTIEATQSADFTAVVGNLYPIDVSAGSVVVTPPAAADGARFAVVDSLFAVETTTPKYIIVSFDAAGQTLFGTAPDGGTPPGNGASDFVINQSGGYVEFVYIDAVSGWIAKQ